ncbi:MAG: class I SAM-dependent methyltransferase [Chloroflexi bacterium]|nr:class I SAM-dependent methyltransferase [Chloroflexota bacterium]
MTTTTPATTHPDRRARHTRDANRSVNALAWSFFVRLRWQYFPLLLSDYAREILRRKYDAIATDRAYINHASGAFGPIGKVIDRAVLNFPTHEGLRQRLRLVSRAIEVESRRRLELGQEPVRVLSAPSGLLRDVITALRALQTTDPLVLPRIEVHALDLDATGEVIPLARNRASAAGVNVAFYREDLFDSPSLKRQAAEARRFDVVNCIGLTTWLDLDEVGRLARIFRETALVPNGALIVDNWARHKYSDLGKQLEIRGRYHTPAEFTQAFTNNGFRVIRSETTPNGVVTVYVFEPVPKPAGA